MHHEQGAAFAAEGYARYSGKLGVAMSTSGPGATNLITSIGSCFFDSVPCLFITGQVNTYEYKYDLPVRQIGFQETDIVNIVAPITKGARLVKDIEKLQRNLEWAVNLATSERPGPVLLDIPMDVQRSDIEPDKPESKIKHKDPNHVSDEQLKSIVQKLKDAKRPVILAGGGVRSSNACKELYDFVKSSKIPVVVSLMGLDSYPHTHDSFVGMIGTYGNRSANFVIANADFLLVLGSRLDIRQTGSNYSTFARNATIVRVDIDENELNNKTNISYPIKANIKDFLIALSKKITVDPAVNCPQPWLDYVQISKNKFPVFTEKKSKKIDPNEFIYMLSQEARTDAIITVDTGQHQMWTAQSFEVKTKQRVLISGGMGAMGFALPAAIGVALSNRDKEIIVIVGDGGLQINIQELQTIVRNNLNIKIIVLNNGNLGMVRQFQEVYFNGRTEGTLQGYSNPDFTKLAEAYGIHAIKLSSKNDIQDKIKNCLAYKGSCLLDVTLPICTVVSPKLLVNDPIEDQYPKLSDKDFDDMMLIPYSR